MSEIINKRKYMNEYMKKYIKESPQIDCPCGSVFKAYKKYYHVKTKKHIKYVSEKLKKEMHEELKENALLNELLKE